jgi:hypothetical protein
MDFADEALSGTTGNRAGDCFIGFPFFKDNQPSPSNRLDPP